MSKDIKLNLKVDSSSGEASIKRTSAQIKGLGTTAAAGGAAIGAGAKTTAGGMLMMGAATTKAAADINKMGKNTTAVTKEFKKQYKAAAKVADHMEKTSKSMVEYAATQTKANEAATKLGQSINNNNNKHITLIKSMTKNTKEALKMAAAHRNTAKAMLKSAQIGHRNVATLKKYEKALESTNKDLKYFRREHIKATKEIKAKKLAIGGSGGKSGLIGMLIQYKALIAGIGFAAVISSGAEFEREMATVGGVMRASKKDMVALTNAAKTLGSKSEHGANKAAQALKFMGMAGYTATQAIKALPGVLSLATASGLDLAAVSDIVTDSLTAMNMKVEDLGRFNDVLTGVTTRSNTTILMMGESLKYVAPVASQMGYDIEQLSAMLGILANSGIKASDAGTDLRQAMIKNVKVSKIFGTVESDLIGTLEKAVDAGWGVTEVTEKYGLIAAKSVLVLMKQIKEYKELEEELRNVEGETKKLADAKLDTLAGDFNLFKAAVEGFGLKLYDNVVDPLRTSVQLMTELTNWTSSFVAALEKVYTSNAFQAMLLLTPFISGQQAMKGIDLLTERIKLEDLLAIAIKKRAEAEKLGQTEVVAQFDYIITNFKNQIKKLDDIGIKTFKVTTDAPITERIRLENLLTEAIKRRAEAEKFGQTKYVGQFDNAIIILKEQLAALGEEEKPEVKKELTDAEKTAAAAKIKLRKQVLEEFRRAQLSETQLALDNLDIQKARFEEFIKDEKVLNAWYNGEKAKIAKVGHDQVLEYISSEEENTIRSIKKMRDDLLLFAKTAEEMDAINLTAELKIKEVKTGPKEASAFVDAWESALDEVESLFSDVFSDAINDELDSFKDYFNNILEKLQQMSADHLAELLVDWLKHLAEKKLASSAAALESTDSSAGGGAYGLALYVVIGMFRGLMDILFGDDDEEEKSLADDMLDATAMKDSIDSLIKTLEKNSDSLDAQLDATHSWSIAFSTAMSTHKSTMDDLYKIYGRSTSEWENPAALATLNFWKEMSIIVRDINKDLIDFEDSITSLTKTTYDVKMLEFEKYYADMLLAITDTIGYQQSLEHIISAYDSAYNQMKESDRYTQFPEWAAWVDDYKKSADGLRLLQVDYSNLLSDWEGSYEEALEALEEYFAEKRTDIIDDVKKYTKGLVGPVSDMEKALSSVTSKFESWITTIKDLGTTTSELLLIQENWLASIQAAADKAIFDPFESVLEDLLLLEAQVGGTSKSDYYLSKYQAALAGDEWIAASEYLLEWYNAQDEATSAWESVTTSVEGLVKSIDDVINSIKYSSLNVSLPTAIADLAEQDYATLKAAALAGGTSDIEDFISFATTYLQKTQESLKSSSEYQAAYDQVMSDLVSFQDKLIAGDYDQKIYNELSDLNENLLQIGTNLESHLVNLRAAFESGFNPADYAGFAKGGIASGPTSGYVAALHGREAVIPLDGGDIPVKITGASTGQPLSINVYIGNEQLDTHITRQADMIRVKSNRRTNIPTQRLF